VNRKLPAIILSISFILGLCPPITATASDTEKEARWAEQIVDSLLDGDAVWLDAQAGR